jgi:hypothetical protein
MYGIVLAFGLGEISRSLFLLAAYQDIFCLLSSSLDFSLMFLLNVLLIMISENITLAY